MMRPDEERGITTLLGDALAQFNKLFQNEIDLAKAELAEKAKQVGGAVAFFACGAFFITPAIVMLLFAISATLINSGWSNSASYLISALIAALIAAVLFIIGMTRLDAKHLKPAETMRQLEKDKDAVKGIAR